MNPPWFERVDGVTIAHVVGDIDAANAALLAVQLGDGLDEGTSTLIVDLGESRYLDSAGIDMLLRLAERLRARRAKLVLVIPGTSQLSRLAKIVGLPTAIDVFPEIAGAVEAASSRAQVAVPRARPDASPAGG